MFYKRVVERELSVRNLEQLIRSHAGNGSKSGTNVSKQNILTPELKRIQDDLSGVFGSKVSVRRNAKGKGTLTIHFTSDHNLNHILDILQPEED